MEIPFEAIGSWRAHRSLRWNGFGNTCLGDKRIDPHSSSKFHEKSWGDEFFGVCFFLGGEVFCLVRGGKMNRHDANELSWEKTWGGDVLIEQ